MHAASFTRGTRPGRQAGRERARGPVTLTPCSPGPEVGSRAGAGRVGGRGHWAPGTHRPEAGSLVGAQAGARQVYRRQAAGPAAAPPPKQKAAVRHDRPRDPLGPGALRRRCSAAAGRQLPVASASWGPLRGQTSRLLAGPAAARRAHALDARFSRPRRAGVLAC